MPDTVQKLENEALRDCMSLFELRFSAKLDAVSDGVCTGCSSLRTVVIPEGPKYIQQNAFRGCSSLQEAYIPDSIIEISGNDLLQRTVYRSQIIAYQIIYQNNSQHVEDREQKYIR